MTEFHELLKKAEEAGLNALTLFKQGGQWMASSKWTQGAGYSFHYAKTPEAALHSALNAIVGKRRVRLKK